MTEKVTNEKSMNELLDNYVEGTKQFNIFKILKLENYEIRHSNLIAWLLNPYDTHDLGSTFLSKFLSVINDEIKYEKTDSIEIFREQENIDILVLNHTRKYLILIENKINSNQHDNQLERYQSISDYGKYFVYLKPENNEDIMSEYKYVSYKSVKNILENLIQQNIKQETALILKNYVQILNERYLQSDNHDLMDICIKLIENNEVNNLSNDKKELVWKMAEKRRYEIMQIISEILSEMSGISVPAQNNIYRVQFNKSYSRVNYVFDNTGTKNNSEIYFLTYDDMTPNMLFLNEQEYNEIYYQYNDEQNSAYEKMKEALKTKIVNILSNRNKTFTI